MIENEKIVDLVQSGEDINNNLMRLYEQNKPFIYARLKRFFGVAETDDLLQEAFIALIDAVQTFKPDKGYKFLTHYGNVLKWHISSFAEGNDIGVSEKDCYLIKKYKRFCTEYETTNGVKPSIYEIMDALDINKATLKKIQDAERLLDKDSLYRQIGEDLEIIDTIEGDNSAEEIEDAFDRGIRDKVIHDQVSRLKEEQRVIIELIYFKGLSIPECCRVLQIAESKGRFRQHEALRKLRKELKEINENSGIFDEFIACYSGVFKGGKTSFMETNTSITEKTALKILELENLLKKEIKQNGKH